MASTRRYYTLATGSMKPLICLSPAKINLFLHILGRRADGYHNLQTVFQFLNYCDELAFSVRTDACINLQCSLPNLPIEKNLIFRAAILLQQLSGTTLGADIKLQKKIPIGGGLGGGSSNAATTLIALNHLWQLKLKEPELARLGLQLGADVPIFIHGKAAWGEGLGEHLTPISLKEPWYVVIVPPCPVSTAEIFSSQELTRNTPPLTIQQFLAQPELMINDCEKVVCKLYPDVAMALDWLNQFAPAKMTGTGGCLFAPVHEQNEAEAIVEQIPKPFYGFSAKGLNISPLKYLDYRQFQR